MALRKVATTPSKIASALDWRKISGSSILTLDIHQNRIGMAVSSHPTHGDEVKTLDSINISNRRGEVDKESLDHLYNVVKDHKVCGFVVSFPVQKDTGKMGAACGRVLHTLEDLLKKQQQAQAKQGKSSASITPPAITPNRPLCFWDSSHASAEAADEWGRCSSYAVSPETSNIGVHSASKEQYYQDENVVAAQVWDDFCKAQWPELYAQERKTSSASPAPVAPEPSRQTSSWDDIEENWEDSSAYVNTALL